MSRIGKAIINIPEGVKVSLNGKSIQVEGPKGKMSHTVHDSIGVEVKDNTVSFIRSSESPSEKALHGTNRALVANMVTGVSKGFTKELEIIGVGYRGEKKGKGINFSLGYSHPIVFEPPEGIFLVMEGTTKVIVSGIDKQKVGQVAAEIRGFRKPEPYKGKGVRLTTEVVRRKEVKKS